MLWLYKGHQKHHHSMEIVANQHLTCSCEHMWLAVCHGFRIFEKGWLYLCIYLDDGENIHLYKDDWSTYCWLSLHVSGNASTMLSGLTFACLVHCSLDSSDPGKKLLLQIHTTCHLQWLPVLWWWALGLVSFVSWLPLQINSRFLSSQCTLFMCHSLHLEFSVFTPLFCSET